ncbi:iron uptake porin [Calothrix sp. FACHB-156]|nr:iron uptake porin [Calothrix sp. FACHB-156]
MSKKKWKMLTLMLSAILICFITFIAISPISDKVLAQIPSVSQFKDVQPTEWYFQALQSLVERYGSVKAYKDGFFRGQRPATRGEFAVFMLPSLDRVNELIATATADFTKQEDIVVLEKLVDEIEREIQQLAAAPSTLLNTEKFICNVNNQLPETTVTTTDGTQKPIIRWVSNYFSATGYTPELRCQQVSARLQQYRREGKLNFITHSVQNGQKVLCAALTEADAKSGQCTGGLILTLEANVNSAEAVREMKSVLAGGQPLTKQMQRKNYEYLDMNQFLKPQPDTSL